MTVDPNAATQGFPAPEPARRGPHPARYLVPALVAAAVAVALGVYGKVHDPAGTAFNLAGFSSTGAVKSWLATAAILFALVSRLGADALREAAGSRLVGHAPPLVGPRGLSDRRPGCGALPVRAWLSDV